MDTLSISTGVQELNQDIQVGEPTIQLILDAFLQPCGYDIRGTMYIWLESNKNSTPSIVFFNIKQHKAYI